MKQIVWLVSIKPNRGCLRLCKKKNRMSHAFDLKFSTLNVDDLKGFWVLYSYTRQSPFINGYIVEIDTEMITLLSSECYLFHE